jgi:hypothetical protein
MSTNSFYVCRSTGSISSIEEEQLEEEERRFGSYDAADDNPISSLSMNSSLRSRGPKIAIPNTQRRRTQSANEPGTKYNVKIQAPSSILKKAPTGDFSAPSITSIQEKVAVPEFKSRQTSSNINRVLCTVPLEPLIVKKKDCLGRYILGQDLWFRAMIKSSFVERCFSFLCVVGVLGSCLLIVLKKIVGQYEDILIHMRSSIIFLTLPRILLVSAPRMHVGMLSVLINQFEVYIYIYIMMKYIYFVLFYYAFV